MARNAIKSDFWSSKIAAGSHFVNKFKENKSCVLIWNSEKWDLKLFSVIQNGRRQPFCEQNKTKVAYWYEMVRNAIESDFRWSKMAASSQFVKKKVCVLISNGEKCDLKWFSVIQNGRRQPFCCVFIWNGEKCDQNSFSVIQNGGGGASQWPACKLFGDIHSICPWANTPIIVYNWLSGHRKFTKSEIRSSWSWFEHCSKSFIQPPESHIWSLFATIHMTERL